MHSMCVLVYIYLLFCVVLYAYLKFPFIFGLSTVSFSISRCRCAPNKILQIKLAIVHISSTHTRTLLSIHRNDKNRLVFGFKSQLQHFFYHLSIAQKHLFTRIIMLIIHTHMRALARTHTPNISGGSVLTLFFFELFKVDDVVFFLLTH